MLLVNQIDNYALVCNFYYLFPYSEIDRYKLVEFKIFERSPIAWLARKNLKAANVAMVIGRTIHLSGVNKEEFLQNKAWVAHECCHIKQFKENGFWRFLFLYILESWRVGYYNNKYEVEAREAGTKEAYRLTHISGKTEVS